MVRILSILRDVEKTLLNLGIMGGDDVENFQEVSAVSRATVVANTHRLTIFIHEGSFPVASQIDVLHRTHHMDWPTDFR